MYVFGGYWSSVILGISLFFGAWFVGRGVRWEEGKKVGGCSVQLVG